MTKPLIRQAAAQLATNEFAVLILDDMVMKKPHTNANTLIYTYYARNQGRHAQDLNLISLLYQGHWLALPITAKLVAKTRVNHRPTARCAGVAC